MNQNQIFKLVCLVFSAVFISLTTQSCNISPEIRAQAAAQTIATKQLRSPSSAEFSNTIIRHQKDDWYLVYLECDSQNGFGAMQRSKWHVVLQLTGEETYNYSASTAAQRCDNCDELDAAVAMTLNKWPDTE